MMMALVRNELSVSTQLYVQGKDWASWVLCISNSGYRMVSRHKVCIGIHVITVQRKFSAPLPRMIS